MTHAPRSALSATDQTLPGGPNLKIALIVDVPDRDLAGLVLTALELCQRGATCYLVPASPKEPEIWSIQPDFVLLNYFRKGNDNLATAMIRAGIPFGVLDTEGIWPTLQDYTDLLWSQADLRSQARCVCMWGSKLTEHLLSEGILRKDQVTISGCPRFDYYHPLWKSVLTEDDNAKSNAPARRILFNTTCYFSNPRFTSKTKIVGDLERLFGWDQPTIAKILVTQQEALEAGLDMIRRLAGSFPSAEIVVRPHPYEGPALYESRLRDLANVHVNPGGPVQTQIARAAVVIQRSCTTGIEATFAKVPTLSPKWIPTAFEMPMAEAISVPCQSYEELERNIGRIFEGGGRQTVDTACNAETVIREWFYKSDGLAYRRVSEAVLQSLEVRPVVDQSYCARRLYKIEGTDNSALANVAKRVRSVLNLPPDWSFRLMDSSPAEHWSKTDQFFDAPRVSHLAERIQACRRSQGLGARSIEVRRVREGHDHRFGYRNYSVRLECIE